MLIDAHCHVDAYPQPELMLAAGKAAGVRTLAVTVSLGSYIRTRILCRHHPEVRVALGLHPRRVCSGYEQWAEWKQTLAGAPFVGEAGLDFQDGEEENRTAQRQALVEIAQACAEGNRVLSLHSHYAETEAWEIVAAAHVKWVVWHDYRADGPKALLYRAIEAGHMLTIGPEAAESAALRQRLRAIPRRQVLTETNGPWGCLGAADRAAALRRVLAALAEAWQCTLDEAEAQVESNYARMLNDIAGN